MSIVLVLYAKHSTNVKADREEGDVITMKGLSSSTRLSIALFCKSYIYTYMYI